MGAVLSRTRGDNVSTGDADIAAEAKTVRRYRARASAQCLRFFRFPAAIAASAVRRDAPDVAGAVS